MKQNVGNIDRIIRVIIGLALIGFAVFTQNWWGLIGLAPLFTAVIKFCPAYSLLKVSTNKKVQTEKLKL